MQEKDIHVGDKVRIRQWDDMKQEYGDLDPEGGIPVGPDGCYFNPYMKQYCGRIVTIKSIDTNRLWDRTEYTFDQDCGFWTYTCNMLEPLTEASEITGELD